ncbi:enoyl-CoA delta isomerase 1, mitochondrial-like [Lutzomyia longipalpis]|uniref:enoyl-CoA delta isomerase 1, mitochondrial-like n=1 Tax=Lutzomyia longipalpis TaxID=7200 RepID=UPI0024841AAA|nr:enoyl-CoA delta isomerase 1, mitochondrial-like [Lutzomyia longipalpis]XP_055685195.1 enoyl-CoA delta isomerase 1, mitochondrial-like [Lutzomyia longipalpis]XP_055685196.1 enoyl-CoA delta isomerase 1, mitochondrial-like [Lutzomyia longipalpis]
MFLPFVRRFPPLVLRGSYRFASTDLVRTQVDDKTGIAVVSMNRAPVNSLNLDLLREISSALDDVEKNKSTGMILTSTAETVFSAGLDITEMYKPEQARLKEFWTTLQDVWTKLFGSSFPTAAAINGHAPAGGCLLAMSCEYRVMRPNFTIGLNETQLGIVAPIWFMATMENILPRREAELALTLGKMFSTEKAREIGLVDDVVATKEEAIAKCTDFIQLFAKVPKTARALTKQAFRRRFLETLDREQDLQMFLYYTLQPQVQKGLGLYMDRLKKK